MKTCYVFFLFFIVIFASTCKKEYSYEGGKFDGKASGSLLDLVGTCLPAQISGNYIIDSNLNAANLVTIQANITAPGKYVIYTDTVNGFWFRDTGTISSTGKQIFTLKGSGKPNSIAAAVFTVHFKKSVCQFTIAEANAVYIFNAPANSCPAIKVNGTYYAGATLNAGDTINVPVTVLQPGKYIIATTQANGMLFMAKGSFAKRGNYTVTLTGNGKPPNAETTIMPLTIGNMVCSFPVKVILDTSMNWRCTVEGITYRGLLDSGYRVLPDTPVFFGTQKKYVFQDIGADMNHAFSDYGFAISIQSQDYPITPGLFTVSNSKNNGYVQLISNISPSGFGYNYLAKDILGGFTVELTSYNRATKLIEGTFSGSVYKGTSVNYETTWPVFQITNGYFKTYMAY